jgi:hypothetical protein
VAGLLVAAVFELKVFLWLPFAVGLAVAAALRPTRDGDGASALRTAAVWAWIGALPALAATLSVARAMEGRFESGLAACLGCFPAWVLDRSFGGSAGRDWFAAPSWADLIDPRAWAVGLGAMGVWAVIHLGVRGLALPPLWRALRDPERGDEGGRAVLCVLGAAGIVGLVLTFATATRPYPLNAGQFAWAASFGLWPVLGLVLGRAAQRGGRLVLLTVGALAVPTGLFWILGQGLRAVPHHIVSLDERILLETLRDSSRPGERVLEPSLRMGEGRLSPVPWLARRPVYASLGAIADYLAPDERARRERVVADAFESPDPVVAMAAIRASGARLVYSPAERPLSFAPGPGLRLVRANPAGAILRVVEERGP